MESEPEEIIDIPDIVEESVPEPTLNLVGDNDRGYNEEDIKGSMDDVVMESSKIEVLSYAIPITDGEFKVLYDELVELPDNLARLTYLDEKKLPFLFSASQLLQLFKITPSVKTKVSFVSLIGPRLVDPSTKFKEIVNSFRFAAEKEKVEGILKKRGLVLNTEFFNSNSHDGGRRRSVSILSVHNTRRKSVEKSSKIEIDDRDHEVLKESASSPEIITHILPKPESPTKSNVKQSPAKSIFSSMDDFDTASSSRINESNKSSTLFTELDIKNNLDTANVVNHEAINKTNAKSINKVVTEAEAAKTPSSEERKPQSNHQNQTPNKIETRSNSASSRSTMQKKASHQEIPAPSSNGGCCTIS